MSSVEESERHRLWQIVDALSRDQAASNARLEALETRLERSAQHQAENMALIRSDLQSIQKSLDETRSSEQKQAGIREANRKWATWVISVIGILVAAGYFGREAAAMKPGMYPPQSPAIPPSVPCYVSHRKN